MKKIVKRELLEKINRCLKLREYLAILGPRQSGKTTLLELIKQDSPEAEYLSFENSKILRLFEGDIDSFIELYCKNKKLLLIDEFQYALEGGKNLKYIYDTFPHLKIILTGSSSLELRAKVGKYMVGRILFFHLLPFSFAEYLSCKAPRLHSVYKQKRFNFQKPSGYPEKFLEDPLGEHFLSYFEEYLLYGGYPKVVTTKTYADKKIILEGIFSTYILRDVIGFWKIEKERDYQTLVNLLALQIGSLCNYQELSRSSGLKYFELLSYLEALRQTFVLQEVRPFCRNPRTELIKTPKNYFLDLGLRNFVTDNFLKLAKRNDRGELAENFILNHLLPIFRKINFWRTKSKAEVDFVARKENKIIPIEVKFQPGFNAIPKSLYSFFDKYSPSYGIIATRNTRGIKKIGRKKIYFYPIYLI